MTIACDKDGTDCKRASVDTESNTSSNTNTILGLVLGSIALLIFIVLIVILVYMLYCKTHYRNRIQFYFRSNRSSQRQRSTTNVLRNQQKSQFDRQMPPTDLPAPNQQVKTNSNTVRFE